MKNRLLHAVGHTRVRLLLFSAALFLVLVASSLYLVFWNGDGARAARTQTGIKILLIGTGDSEDQSIGFSVVELQNSGWQVTTDGPAAVSRASSEPIDAFVVTRSVFDEVPASLWFTLHQKGTLIGGIDISMHELEPLAIPGAAVGSGWLTHNQLRPIFSIIYGSGCAKRDDVGLAVQLALGSADRFKASSVTTSSARKWRPSRG